MMADMSKIKEQLDAVFTKEMDRKNFLKYSGSIILGILGVTGLLRLLLGSHLELPVTPEPAQPKSAAGYGSSRYGQ